jgi:hypothetical protein
MARVPLLVGEAHGQLAGESFGRSRAKSTIRLRIPSGEAVPDAAGAVLQCLGSTYLVKIVPATKDGPWDAELLQGATDRQV